jgi:hypothetical protein
VYAAELLRYLSTRHVNGRSHPPAALIARKETPSVRYIGRSVGPTVCHDVLEKRRKSVGYSAIGAWSLH